MLEMLSRLWDNLLARTEGPLHFRFFLQPVMSLFFAIRAGIRDAKNNQVPYLWRFTVSKDQRRSSKKEGWKDVGKVFIVGIIIDIIYQLIVIYKFETQTRFYPLESIVVAFVLAIVPYVLFRGPVNRFLRLFIKRNKSGKA
ncbi:MAG TPA: hypothetical protein VGN20_13860 [Mucilaginibacter sp.]|jgi:hypothetical protein